MLVNCTWPRGTCACLLEQARKPEDSSGRVWMHCESGLNFSKASMSRFIMFCLGNDVEIGSIHAFAPEYPRCQVSAAIRLRPDQFAAFEAETGGKLRPPPKLRLNFGETES